MRLLARKILRTAGSHDPVHHALQSVFLALVLGVAVVGSAAVVTESFMRYVASSLPHGLID